MKFQYPPEISFDISVGDLYKLRDLYGGYNNTYDFKWNPYDYDDDHRPLYVYNHGKLAIFTLPQYKEVLDKYVAYKKDRGFTVDVHVSNAYINAKVLRDSIRHCYYYSEKPPKYVLIVGDVNQIPYSKGVLGDVKNPPTDLYYACIENADIRYEENCIPEVLLGRWPARNAKEVNNMIVKSITFEAEISAYRGLNKKRCSFLSGTGKYESSFYNDIKPLGKHLHDVGYSANLYDGRIVSQSNAPVVVDHIMSDNNWMLIYNGHGSCSGVSSSFGGMFSSYKLDSIKQNSSFCPITFFFACSINSNNLEDCTHGAFGLNWVREHQDKGGVAMLASTTTAYVLPDYTYSLKIFKSINETGNDPYLGDLIANGQTKYYNASKTSLRRHQVERYQLIGDPSLMIYGFYRNGIPYQNAPEYTDSEADGLQTEIEVNPTVADGNIIVSVGDNVCANVDIYNLNGALVATRQRVSGEVRIATSGLIEGCYIVTASVDGRIVHRDKIFVKH